MASFPTFDRSVQEAVLQYQLERLNGLLQDSGGKGFATAKELQHFPTARRNDRARILTTVQKLAVERGHLPAPAVSGDFNAATYDALNTLIAEEKEKHSPAASKDVTHGVVPRPIRSHADSNVLPKSRKARQGLFDPENPEELVASYYKSGRKTGNGEKFNPRDLTAASLNYPYGSVIRVEHGDRSVQLRVNDSGPYVRGRQLDVTERAAEVLGFKHQGVARLKVTYLGNVREMPELYAAWAGQDERHPHPQQKRPPENIRYAMAEGIVMTDASAPEGHGLQHRSPRHPGHREK